MKKNYTIFYLLLILFTGLTTFVSCEDKDDSVTGDLSLLQVNPDTLRFVVEGGEAKLSIWTLFTWFANSEQEEWCKVKRTGSLLSVTVQTNTGDKRMTTVQVKAGELVRKVVVMQEGMIPGQTLRLTRDRLELTCMEQGVVGVKALLPWDIEMPEADKSWCKVTKNPMGGIMVTLRGNEEHHTEITVVSGEERKTFEVTQKKYNFTYQVGELYQDENGEFSGIIFYRENNRIGIISLLEGYTTFMVPGDPDIKKYFGFATSEHALNLVKRDYPDDWHSRFPMLAWADDLNTRYHTSGWYLLNTSDGALIGETYDQLREQNTLVELWGGEIFPIRFMDGGGELHTFLMTIREEKDENTGFCFYHTACILGSRGGGVGARKRDVKVSCRAVKYVNLP